MVNFKQKIRSFKYHQKGYDGFKYEILLRLQNHIRIIWVSFKSQIKWKFVKIKGKLTFKNTSGQLINQKL